MAAPKSKASKAKAESKSTTTKPTSQLTVPSSKAKAKARSKSTIEPPIAKQPTSTIPVTTSYPSILTSLTSTLKHPDLLNFLLSSSTSSSSSSSSSPIDDDASIILTLQSIITTLFTHIDTLLQSMHSSAGSGLNGQLYIDSGGGDVESLWGQIEMLNEVGVKVLKKGVRRLVKGCEGGKGGGVVLLEGGESESESEGEGEGQEGSADEDGDESGDDEDDNSNETPDQKRMRIRMEAMDDDEDGSDLSDLDEGDEDNSEENLSSSDDEDESTISSAPGAKQTYSTNDDGDPMGNPLRDGFFDVDEMEGFADEEEELHNQDFSDMYEEDGGSKKKGGKSQSKSKKASTYDNDGGQSDDDDDDDNESGLNEEDDDDFPDNDTSSKGKIPSKKPTRKLRTDEDMNVLSKLYDYNSDEDAEGADITGEEFFGRASRETMERYKKVFKPKAKEERKTSKKSKNDWVNDEDEKGEVNKDDDEDEEDEEDQEENWRDEQDSSEQPPGDDAYEGITLPLSASLAARTFKLLSVTKQLENEALAEKPWTMTGEVKGTTRPVDSLLEAGPEFERAGKIAPVITVKHTEDLESIIKRRIVREEWDDVIPRELPSIGTGQKKGMAEVSQEKSKLGLGELYERDYLKKAVGYDQEKEEKETEESKAKDEMKQLFAKLSSKLDALSNYHFTPRPVAEETNIRSLATPAIAMEEVMPLNVSTERGFAPEEVYGAKRGRSSVLKGDNELEQEDRKRLRGTKKTARRAERANKLADEKLVSRVSGGLGLDNPYEKRKQREDLERARSKGKVSAGVVDDNTDYNTSAKFFERLQRDVKGDVKGFKDRIDGKGKKAEEVKGGAALRL